jgi:hypothetical protein
MISYRDDVIQRSERWCHREIVSYRHDVIRRWRSSWSAHELVHLPTAFIYLNLRSSDVISLWHCVIVTYCHYDVVSLWRMANIHICSPNVIMANIHVRTHSSMHLQVLLIERCVLFHHYSAAPLMLSSESEPGDKFLCMYVCMYVRTNVCMYVCMYVYMYVHWHARTTIMHLIKELVKLKSSNKEL